MNQLSSIGFGTDANVFAGYAQSANERLGNIDFVFENTGPNQAYIKLMQYDGVSSPSGFAVVGIPFTVVPGGVAAGEALVAHPGVNKISFTGGTATARHVLRGAAANLTPVILELG